MDTIERLRKGEKMREKKKRDEKKDIKDWTSYTQFVESFVSCVVGKTLFRRNKVVRTLSTFTDISDEAFAVLVLKNNYNVWSEWFGMSMEERKGKKLKDLENKQSLFENNTYSKEGIAYYHSYMEKVKRHRDKYTAFDKYYLHKVQCKLGQTKPTVSMTSQRHVHTSYPILPERQPEVDVDRSYHDRKKRKRSKKRRRVSG